MPCYEEGALRAYRDGESAAGDRDAIAAHLQECAGCRRCLHEQRDQSTRVGGLLGKTATATHPGAADPAAALARLQQSRRTDSETSSRAGMPAQQSHLWRNVMSMIERTGGYRPTLVSLAAAAAGITLLSVPSVQSVANDVLQSFRVQNVVFMSIQTDRLHQLEQLNINPRSLLVGKPQFVGRETPPQKVATPDQAASLVGFSPRQPTAFPDAVTESKTLVFGRHSARAQVNLESLRQALAVLNVDDVTLPDALGQAPITVDLPPYVQNVYRGQGFELRMFQGVSPTVTLPQGVDLPQLGRAGLRVLGMTPERADALSRQIDWGSTLLFPFPADSDDVRQVQIGEAQGLLIGRGNRKEGANRWALYWQQGERFTVLEGEGEGMSDGALIATAESLR